MRYLLSLGLTYILKQHEHKSTRNPSRRLLFQSARQISKRSRSEPLERERHSRNVESLKQRTRLFPKCHYWTHRFSICYSSEGLVKCILLTSHLGLAPPLFAGSVGGVCIRLCSSKSVRKYADEATFCIPPAEVHLFEKSKIPTEAKLTKQEALIIYENMQMVRRMEIECSNLYKSKLIFGFCHLYAGSEAVGCALKSSMQPKDDVITSYRCHAFAMMFLNEMGKDGVQGVVSELTGRVDGVVKGKGGSMHMYVPHQFFGGQGIVGGQVPLGLGLSFAHKYKEDGGVSLILYGDGAANQGQVYESFNMAQLFKLPAVFICENNQYGMGTAKERSSASTDYYLAGRVIPGVKTDGMDVINVREISKFVMEHCRSGNGPVIMQLETYRYFGHSMSDPGTSYRSREEVQEVRKNNDPINKYKNMLLDKELVTKEELAEIDKKAKKHCADAKKKAATGKFPDDKEVYNYIYKNCLEQPRKPIIAG